MDAVLNREDKRKQCQSSRSYFQDFNLTKNFQPLRFKGTLAPTLGVSLPQNKLANAEFGLHNAVCIIQCRSSNSRPRCQISERERDTCWPTEMGNSSNNISRSPLHKTVACVWCIVDHARPLRCRTTKLEKITRGEKHVPSHLFRVSIYPEHMILRKFWLDSGHAPKMRLFTGNTCGRDMALGFPGGSRRLKGRRDRRRGLGRRIVSRWCAGYRRCGCV